MLSVFRECWILEIWREGRAIAAEMLQALGSMFAFISLAAGIVFLVYALKYYLSVIIVLLGSRNNLFNNSEDNNSNSNDKKSENEPFVSIHLPLYNEKNVVNRIMKACTSLNYKNYEVVVIDDSTDETTKILKEQWGNYPQVKIIHRKERRGFKGGALNEALKHMNPRADYVLVFDADFMPPQDVVNRFLWYFENSNYMNKNNRRNKSEDVVFERIEDWYRKLETVAVQGYQWHMLNAGENWLTRGVRVEYSGNYMVERTCQEAFGAMKMIAGSVFMIKANILRKYRWSMSLTEDWELTLRLYMDGYKVVYTPLIQAPAECPSTIRRLVRQRFRWAEGHTFNVKKYFGKVLMSPRISLMEKFEFIFHYSLYYLQSLLFCLGTTFWILSELVRRSAPFSTWWNPHFGWTLVLINLFSLPIMGLTGLFLERSMRKNLTGILSFVLMSIILAPFQAYASLKGLFEKKEGFWVRTFKTGRVTEAIMALRLRRILRAIVPKRRMRGRN